MKRYQQLQIAPYELPFCFYQILSGHNAEMLSEAVRHSSAKNLQFSHSIVFFSIWIWWTFATGRDVIHPAAVQKELRTSISVQLMTFDWFISLGRLQNIRHSKAINWMDMNVLRTGFLCPRDESCPRAEYDIGQSSGFSKPRKKTITQIYKAQSSFINPQMFKYIIFTYYVTR